jgi:hypothetical protein
MTKYGAFDVRFVLPVLNPDVRVGPVVNVVYETNTNDATAFVINRAAYALLFEAWSYNLATGALVTMFEQCSLSGISVTSKHRLRIVGGNQMVSLYIDDRWMFTFSYTDCTWADTGTEMYMHASDLVNLENVVVSELNVGRNAIFIEMEHTSQSAIDSVLQERPVEAMPGNLGGIRFSYNAIRDLYQMPTHIIRYHKDRDVDVPSAASDAIIYYSDVAVIEDTKYEESDGFVTKIFRLSNLDADAILAGKILLRKMRESQRVHEVTIRADPRVECGDRVTLAYYISGTGTYYVADFIVEEMNFDVSPQEVQMVLAGRSYDP